MRNLCSGLDVRTEKAGEGAIMKKLAGVCFAMVLTLWAGYLLGYHQGTRDEERAWLSSEPGTPDRTDGQLVAYRNPHVGTGWVHWDWEGMPRENRPDPRVYRQYEGLAP